MIISKITDYEMPRDLKGHKNQEICKRAARQTNVFISAPKMGTGRRIIRQIQHKFLFQGKIVV